MKASVYQRSDQGIEHLGDPLLLHGADHAPDLGAVVLGAPRRGRQKAEGEHAAGMLAGIGRADHPAERMAGEMRLPEAGAFPEPARDP